MIEFINQNINYTLVGMIILSGRFITKYTTAFKIKNTYKVLIASIIFSVIFYLINGKESEINKYLFSYLFATSFYEILVKKLFEKMKAI